VTNYLPSFFTSFSQGNFQLKPLDDFQCCHNLHFIFNEHFSWQKIGLIRDKHSLHYSEEVLELIDRCNSDKSTQTRIIHELVDKGLTPIIQVPDVAVNKVFKSTVKKVPPL
jgi:hypothetical protein